MKVAFLCVGISDYPDAELEGAERPLRFAALSAEALAARLRKLWPDAGARGVVLTDQAASPSGLDAAVSGLADDGPPDLFVFYFAGHGRGENALLLDGGLLSPTSGGEIARTCARVNGGHTVLIFDCCFAGAVAKSAARRTEGQTLLLASASAEERAWEDAELQRTCFATALDHALSEADPREGGAIFRTSFAAIQERTAATAYGLKEGVFQHPELIDEASDSEVVERPGLLPGQAIRRRIRATLVGLAVLVLLGAATTMALTYRVGVDANGRLVLHYGPKALSVLNEGPFDVRRETRFTLRQIPDPENRKRISEGGIWGFWSSRDATGQREWIGRIGAMLSPGARQQTEMRIGGRPDLAGEELPPFALAEALLLHGETAIGPAEVARYWARFAPRPRRSCGEEEDFSVDRFSPDTRRRRANFLETIRLAAATSDWFDDAFLRNLIILEQDEEPSFTDKRVDGLMFLAVGDSIASRRMRAGLRLSLPK